MKKQDNKTKVKIPYAVFIPINQDDSEIKDYKQIFTDIISDRIKEKSKNR